jgi:hypothetical protein
MPKTFSITAISGIYPDIAVNYHEKTSIHLIGIFYPPGEPISPHRLRWCPFAVVHYSRDQALSSWWKRGLCFVLEHLFTTKPDPNFLAAAAILARE